MNTLDQVTLENVMNMSAVELKVYTSSLSFEERQCVFRNMRWCESYHEWIPRVREEKIKCSECGRVIKTIPRNNPSFPELDPIPGEFL